MGQLNRRALFGVVPAAAVLAAPMAVMAAETAALDRECSALHAIIDGLDWDDDAAIAVFHRREKVFLDAVEALPVTTEHASIRARAVKGLYRDHPNGPMAGLIENELDQQTPAQRLTCQIIGSLWGTH